MLLTNQWLDKLAAARIDFDEHGMLGGIQANPVATRPPLPASVPVDVDENGGDVERETSRGVYGYHDAQVRLLFSLLILLSTDNL